MKTSVLLISIDTLRADVAYSGKFPTLDRFCSEGSYFRRVVSSVPLTPGSHASILTGLQPPNHGIRHLLHEQMRDDVPTLATKLAEVGYNTCGIVSCPGMNRWYGHHRGFAHWDDEIPLLPDGRDPLQVRDVKMRGIALKRAPLVVQRAVNWVASGSREPFFLFLHFFDTHWPYEPPEDVGIEVANRYEGEVAFADFYINLLLNELKSVGCDPDELLIVCLSDHGEDLAGWYPNDHGGELGHPEEEGHGCLLFDATQLVPLWLRKPELLSAGLEISQQVRLVDVAPTILELLGLPPYLGDGQSLVPYLRGANLGHLPAYFETFFPEEHADSKVLGLSPLKGVRLADRTKIIWRVKDDVVELYDLSVDPNERSPLQLSARPPEISA